MKRNKGLLILTTLLTLIPFAVGLLLWDRLPEQIPTHWNMDGEIDGWSSKNFAVFGICGFIALIHLVCAFITFADPKNKGHNEGNMWLMLWICPVMSVFVSAMMYCAALGLTFNTSRIMPIFLGAMFIVIGNYMPKFKQNSTIGIKIPWTLHDEENWTATHRFASRIWVAGGVVVMVTGVLGIAWIMLAVLLVMAIAPMVYSYRFYKKKFG